MSSILEDFLTDELEENRIGILVEQAYNQQIESNLAVERSKTAGPSKNLKEFYDLVNRAMIDYQAREGVSLRNTVNFTEEDPQAKDETEVISFRLMRREPGAFSQGSPFEGPIKNLRPVTRESGKDPTNPDYRYNVSGYWYDNLIRFTCWCRTNKQANERARWFEDFMEDYTWWFRLQGVSRVLFWGRGEDQTVNEDGNKWYGRPLEYFVRTEKLRKFEEKKLEQILIRLDTK